jgi:hypothetical protein
MSERGRTTGRRGASHPQRPTVAPGAARRASGPATAAAGRKRPEGGRLAPDPPRRLSKQELIERHAQLKETPQRRRQQLENAILEMRKLEEDVRALESGRQPDDDSEQDFD